MTRGLNWSRRTLALARSPLKYGVACCSQILSPTHADAIHICAGRVKRVLPTNTQASRTDDGLLERPWHRTQPCGRDTRQRCHTSVTLNLHGVPTGVPRAMPSCRCARLALLSHLSTFTTPRHREGSAPLPLSWRSAGSRRFHLTIVYSCTFRYFVSQLTRETQLNYCHIQNALARYHF